MPITVTKIGYILSSCSLKNSNSNVTNFQLKKYKGKVCFVIDCDCGRGKCEIGFKNDGKTFVVKVADLQEVEDDRKKNAFELLQNTLVCSGKWSCKNRFFR